MTKIVLGKPTQFSPTRRGSPRIPDLAEMREGSRRAVSLQGTAVLQALQAAADTATRPNLGDAACNRLQPDLFLDGSLGTCTHVVKLVVTVSLPSLVMLFFSYV